MLLVPTTPETSVLEEIAIPQPETSAPEEVLAWTQKHVRSLTSHQRRHLDVGELPTVSFQELSGEAFLEDPTLAGLREDVFMSIDRGFAPYERPPGNIVHRDEKFRVELKKADLKVCMTTCGGRLLQIHTVEDIPGGIKNIDWLAANPKHPVKGLSGEACFVKSVAPVIENNDCVADVRPYEQSALVMMEKFGFIAYGMTDQRDKQYASYMRTRRFQSNTEQYDSHSLRNNQIQKITELCDAQEVDNMIDYPLTVEGRKTPLKAMKVSFQGVSAQGDLNDCELYQFLRKSEPQNSWVMTRLIPSPSKEARIFYCVFEQSKLNQLGFTNFTGNIEKWRQKKEDY